MKTIGPFVVLVCFSLPGLAQNTKGDRPIPNQKQVREARFKTFKKRKRIKTRDISGRRLRTLNKSSASRANRGWEQPDTYRGRDRAKTDKAARPRGRIFDTPPSDRSRAWKGDISGHKIRIQSEKSRSARSNVFPQRGPFVNNPSKKPRARPKVYQRTASGAFPVRRVPQDRQRAWKGNIKGGPVGTPSRSGRYKKVYPQSGRFVNHSSKSGRDIQRAYPNESKIKRAAKRESPSRRGKRGSVFPHTRSGPFIMRGKKNVYWGKFSKGEKPYKGDITGRPVRMRNFRSVPAGLVGRDSLKFFGRRPRGDKAYRGRAGGGWGSVRGRNKNLAPLPPRAPGIGADGVNYSGRFRRGELSPVFSRQGTGYPGNLKSRRRAKGGGSVSGKRWNNNGTPIPVRTPRNTGIAGFSGTFRRGELSPGFSKQGIGFAGNIKTRRPEKGGRSVSGKRWNNNGTPIPVRTPRNAAIAGFSGTFKRGEISPGFSKQGIGFAGNIKTRRPEKGGGSVSGKVWNNNGTPIPVRTPKDTGIAGFSGTFRRGEISPGFSKQGAGFAGNIKTKRPEKGGGSVSGKVWNNNGTPIPGSTPSNNAKKAAGYPGNYKLFDLKPSRVYQGEAFTGYIKAKKPKKGGGSISGDMWNNNEAPIDVRVPPRDAKAAGYAGNIRLARLRRNYIQNPNASSASIKKQRPDKTSYEVAGLQVKVKQGDYRNKPHAVKGALPGVAPSRSTVKASEYARGMKMNWNYKHNPNSAQDALMGRAPDKAYARIGDYQGNTKMKKYGGGRLHPDAQFAHGHRNNVKEERTILMNIRLMWAKLFKKSDTQPDHLKDRERRPRYDKREKGLWYE
ncbi:MAG: hypothetical protein M9954_01865 [Cyclobacteriaceae bacterium]|nr:hypothetical protein [Cyclobacteriaceae bacterium]MCB9237509.1 hypothetical protein [Flammeovirgaceae bacterium]MCO5270388.1 hypothetical protein [Cyclobacteriaceae bacterium]